MIIDLISKRNIEILIKKAVEPKEIEISILRRRIEKLEEANKIIIQKLKRRNN